jgi:2-polyprenyl-6-methoxyphenol hydroxylase-like FAD-dependent oxidoreductase
MKVAISGAGIAGTTLAYWLAEGGHQCLLIEAAPHLRTGGYVVDFWGPGMTVAERMGLLPAVMAAGYHQREVRFVDARSQRAGGFSTDILHKLTGGRFTTIGRGALVELIYGALADRAEMVFGERIARLDEHADGVALTLAGGATHDVDLVIGADGQHSAVRSLRFGPEARYETYLGYAVAAFEVTGYRPRDENVYVIHPTPDHQLARFALRDDRTLFLLVFRSPDPPTAPSDLGPDAIRSRIQAEFGDAGWEAPQILAAVQDVDDIYFDHMSQIRMPGWYDGRVALVGDAAAAVSLLAGEGTGLAMVEATVLADELVRSGADHARAFVAYERRLRPYLERKQRAAARSASAFVPRTAGGVRFRNKMTSLLGLPGVGRLFLGRTLSNDLELPEHPARSH